MTGYGRRIGNCKSVWESRKPEPQFRSPPVPLVSTTGAGVTAKSSPDEKVKLFRSLFSGREDVYAVRWEGRNGKTGYSPACRRVWGNPFQKHSDEPKEYFPLTDQVIRDHLTGKLTAGVYPMLADETCWFLAADFDKATWQEDVRAFLHTCAEWKVPAVLERSRSGRGGHIWIFFEAPHSLPASPENSGQPFLPEQWSGGINWVSIPTTASFQVKTRCPKEASVISSRCRCSTCREVTAIVFSSTPISIRTPTSGRCCPASDG